MRLALPHVDVRVFFSDPQTFAEGFEASRSSPRKRMVKPIHRDLTDGVQRFLNFLQPGTYIAPHFHPLEGFSETILVISGAIYFFEFETDGPLRSRRVLRAGTLDCLVDFVGPAVHTFTCLEPDTALLEIKRGPYAPDGDKCFMDWAPRENEPGVEEYLRHLQILGEVP